MRRSEIKYWLVTWGNKLAEDITESSLPSATTLARCIELGAQGAAIRCMVRPQSNYWPDHKLIQINNAIDELSQENKNMLILHYALGYSFSEVGKKYDLSKWGIMKRMQKVESDIFAMLQ